MGRFGHKSNFRRRGSHRGARGRGTPAGRRGSHFRTSRTEQRDAIDLDFGQGGNGLEQEISVHSNTDESSESEDEKRNGASSYSRLLQTLNLRPHGGAPPRKKQKLHDGFNEHGNSNATPNGQDELGPERYPLINSPSTLEEIDELDFETEDAQVDDREARDDLEGDDREEEDPADLFKSHFANPESTFVSTRLGYIKAKEWTSMPSKLSSEIKQYFSEPGLETDISQHFSKIRDVAGLRLKAKCIEGGQKVWNSLETTEREIAAPLFKYQDVLFGCRTVDNSSRLRDLVALHAANHIFKTRSRVIKNNYKVAQDESDGGLELRDQGFTRPKVLFILPTRQACVRFIESIVTVCQPEQQENKSRFIESFSRPDESSWADKPRDFQELFGGNDDDMFRIGIKFTRKAIKLFSAFYQSDMILASPLGLRTAIEIGGSKEGKTDASNADFLSSIEMVIVDHANALLMQNWQHIEYIFSQLNLLPKESHGCDFSRVRHWYLDGEAKHFRQTVVLSDFITPEINSLYTRNMLNLSGKAKYTNVYKGAMLEILASSFFPAGSIAQTFIRLDTSSPSSDVDVRFSTFISTILPSLTAKKRTTKQQKSTSTSGTGTLIFIPHYHDFVRLRNHLSSASTTTTSPSFGTISEYTSVGDVSRARSHFLTGRHSLLLYSERAHHFRRYRLKGVKRIIFYGIPENPLFWREVVAFLTYGSGSGGGNSSDELGVDSAGNVVKAFFSRWDVLKLERIVGSDRVGRMVGDAGAETFVFT